jgi:opacity protein-like surface antigen
MRVKLSYLTPLLAAGAAAVAISAAPIASAASTTQQSCNESVSGSVCESPGNVEINDTPGPMDFQPYGDDGFLIGGYGGYGFHGGGFGGGHGGGHGGR